MKKRENVTVEIILTIGSYLEETVFLRKEERRDRRERGKKRERDEKRKFVKVTIMCLN